MTATTKGRASNPRASASPIAMGVITTATALLDTISVRIEVSRYSAQMAKTPGIHFNAGAKAITIISTAPECCSAAPMPNMAKIIAANNNKVLGEDKVFERHLPKHSNRNC